MMMKLVVTIGSIALCACSGPAPVPEPAAAAAPTSQAVPVREQLSPDRIYYDLTRFGWYARGEPLLRDGLAYQPAGMPLAAPLREMQRIGEYEGVDYYRREGDAEQLFVPVFNGYWQTFRVSASALSAD